MSWRRSFWLLVTSATGRPFRRLYTCYGKWLGYKEVQNFRAAPLCVLQLWHTPVIQCWYCIVLSSYVASILASSFFKSTNIMKLCVLSYWYQIYILISTGSELYVLAWLHTVFKFEKLIARLHWKNIRREDAGILCVYLIFVTRKTSLFAITIPRLFNASYHGSKPLSKNVMFQILTWKTQCLSPWRNLTAAVVLRSSKQKVTLKQEIDLLSFVFKALVLSFHRSSVREVNHIGVDDFKVNFDIW